jgi:hypothetical protein
LSLEMGSPKVGLYRRSHAKHEKTGSSSSRSLVTSVQFVTYVETYEAITYIISRTVDAHLLWFFSFLSLRLSYDFLLYDFLLFISMDNFLTYPFLVRRCSGAVCTTHLKIDFQETNFERLVKTSIFGLLEQKWISSSWTTSKAEE